MLHVVIDLLENFDTLVAQVYILRLRASTTERSRDGALLMFKPRRCEKTELAFQ